MEFAFNSSLFPSRPRRTKLGRTLQHSSASEPLPVELTRWKSITERTSWHTNANSTGVAWIQAQSSNRWSQPLKRRPRQQRCPNLLLLHLLAHKIQGTRTLILLTHTEGTPRAAGFLHPRHTTAIRRRHQGVQLQLLQAVDQILTDLHRIRVRLLEKMDI